MNIYKYSNYRLFLKDWVQNQPKRGRGILSQMAATTGVHPTFLSQVLSSGKDFSNEQALLVAEFMGLSESQIEYFMILVEREKASHFKLKDRLDQRIKTLQDESQQLDRLLQKENDRLSTEQLGEYYSSWTYIAVHSLIALTPYQNRQNLYQALSIEKSEIDRILQFLFRAGLAVEERGQIKRVGSKSTFIGKESPFIWTHLRNWREVAIQRMQNMTKNDLSYSTVITLRAKDAQRIKDILREAIKKSDEVVESTEPEVMAFLNFDFMVLKE
ncbi:MAG: TIGR02147 family protein [Pseudobdellovibrionaceae bacterium]|jgi:uncharacterized protein (TIGR02147 family)